MVEAFRATSPMIGAPWTIRTRIGRSVAAGLAPGGGVEPDEERHAEEPEHHGEGERGGRVQVRHGIPPDRAEVQRDRAPLGSEAEEQRQESDGARRATDEPERGTRHEGLRAARITCWPSAVRPSA